MSDPKVDLEDLDAEIQGMRARVAELEEEADKKAEAAAMQALLNGEAETPFTPGEVAKGEHGADPAPGGTTEVEVEDEDSTAVDGRSVYVGNVDYGATPEELQQHFLSCGSINRITIVCDKFTGNPKGYAYVEFSDPAFVDTALALNDSLFRGRLIKVVAKPPRWFIHVLHWDELLVLAVLVLHSPDTKKTVKDGTFVVASETTTSIFSAILQDSTMTSLNPASQPFFPRTDSSSALGTGDPSAFGLGGSDQDFQTSPLDTPTESALGHAGIVGGARTPVGGNGLGGPGAIEGSNGSLRIQGEHERVASTISSYQSARSSPSPSSFTNGLSLTKASEALDPTNGGIGHTQYTMQPLTSNSPPDSLGSPSTSASRDGDDPGNPGSTIPVSAHSLTSEGHQQDDHDGHHPLSRSGFSDRSGSSYPAIESFLRRERGGMTGNPSSLGSSGAGDAMSSSPSSGSVETGGGPNRGFGAPPFKWDGLPNTIPPGASPSGYGTQFSSALSSQVANSPFARPPSSRSSTYGPIGKPFTQANDLALPTTPSHQILNPQLQSSLGPIARSMSLSLPVNNAGSQPPSLPARKASFAAFEQNYPPQSRSPLPSSFLNYTIGGNNNSQQQAMSANVTPTSAAFGPNHLAGLGPTSVYPGASAENMSSSPSSVRSGGGHLPDPLQGSFDGQAKASPFINDLLDRLIRCEYSNSNIQREISEMSRKMNILLEHVINNPPNPNGNGDAGRDTHGTSPLAGNSITPTAGTPGIGSGALGNIYSFPNASSTSSLVLKSPTPNSVRERERDDEIRQLNQRIATLTTSVTQLLQAQTQSQIQAMNAGLGGPPSGFPGSSTSGPNGLGGMGVPPHLSGTPDLPQNPMTGLAAAREMGIGNRASPRAPVPVRTWSSSSLEMGLNMTNTPQTSGVGGMRTDTSAGSAMLRDKRRSVMTIGRRDSAGTVIDGGDWGNNPRDGSGPVISKWEQLSLSPELLRSIAKYGVGPPNKIQQRALPFLLRGADIIAQAPPTQERIAAYVIPAIHVALTICIGKAVANRGPVVVIISTTVDQATQAQRMIRDLGGPIGVRSALGVGTGGDVPQELRMLQQNMPHILCGTPQKLHALFTASNGLPGSDVRLLVLDEVDQLIARNLHEFVFNIVKLLPPPRSRPLSQTISGLAGPLTPVGSPAVMNPATFSPFDPTNGGGNTGPFTGPVRRSSTAYTATASMDNGSGSIERQTALFSNTVPQDVLNLANTIQLREPVRVLVRRDGNVNTTESTQTGSRGLRQFYLYLAFTGGGGARGDPASAAPGAGLGIIGSGRGNNSLTAAETAQAREWKLDALADLFDDVDVGQAIVHVGGMAALDAVVYKLASRGLDAIPLHGDMATGNRMAALNKFRGAGSGIRGGGATRVLVVYDVQVKAPDVFQIPLVINYDLPKAVEEYAHRVAPAISNNYSRSGIVINFVTATGGDVEMLRSIECFYKIKCPEVPISLRELF
ncbi:hypothetical protein FRC04_004557 [Tulasnella sp. 424]|nr:hypothetical protein FRC04_004557 [Tulasnella sp. 424]